MAEDVMRTDEGAPAPRPALELLDKKGNPAEVPMPLAPLADTHTHLTSLRKVSASEAIVHSALAGMRLMGVPVDPTEDATDVPALLAWLDREIDAAREELARLAEEGVRPPEFADYPDLPALTDNIVLLVGAHPYNSELLDEAAIGRMEELLASGRCAGVGEFGFDFGPYNKLGPEAQEPAMRLQLRMALEHGVPVELHLRDGEDDTLAHDMALRALEEEGVPEAGCDLHCYTSGPEVLMPYLELGCYAAFGGAMTYPANSNIRAAALRCPTDRLLVETDAPYMTPVPLRGVKCEPAMVAFTADRLARLRETASLSSARETYDALWDNSCRFLQRR